MTLLMIKIISSLNNIINKLTFFIIILNMIISFDKINFFKKIIKFFPEIELKKKC